MVQAAVLLFCACVPLAAQAAALRVVLSAGAADLSGPGADPRWGGRFVAGGGIGVVITFPMSLSVELEGLFAGNGTQFRDDDELFQQRSRYIETPLGVFVSPRVGGSVGVRTGGGVAAAFLTSCQVTLGARLLQTEPGPEQWAVETQECSTGPVNYETRTTNWSVFGEAGAWVGWSRFRASLSARYQRGLGSIVPPQYDVEIFTRRLLGRAGFEFGF